MVEYVIKIIYNVNNNIDEDTLYSIFAEIIKNMKDNEEGDDTNEK